MPDAIQREFSPENRDSQVMRSFGYRMYNAFTVDKAYRRPKEMEWLEDIRQYKGLYDPSVKIPADQSKVYPKITRSKLNIVLSRLHEMLFPETERNFEIEPTPDPKIDKDIVMQIAQSLVQRDPETGQPVVPTAEQLRLAIQKYAASSCEKMLEVIDDQFIEMDYKEEVKEVLRSGLKYGTGIIKGPMVTKRTKRKWEPTIGGDYEELMETEDVPELKNIRLWDFYPDMAVTDYKNVDHVYERHVFRKHDVRKLMKRKGFYADIIEEYLKTHPDGDYTPESWEVDLQVIEVEAGSGNDGTQKQTIITSGGTDTTRSTYRKTGKKYVVLERWGYVDGSDLAACGCDVPDVTLEYGANVWLLGNKVIKAVLYDGAIDLYKLFYYEKDETSIFGDGLPRIVRHSQIAVASAARMVLDNGACVAGPQVEVNVSLLHPDADITSFYSRKIWPREGRGVEAQYPALRAINVESHIDELLSIIKLFKDLGDEETTLPTWLINQVGNNESAQNASNRSATITVSIKDIAKHFDSFTERVIQDMYSWNMEFNPRTDIKGDYTCKAIASESLVMKEIRMQALTQLSSTLTEEEWDYIPRRDFLKEKLKAHDIRVQLLSEEEVQQKQQARQDSEANKLAMDMQRAEIAYKKAQRVGQLAKAKKTNIDAIKMLNQPEETGAEEERAQEAHDQDLQHKTEDHNLDIALKTAKTVSEINQKKEKINGGNTGKSSSNS